MPQIAWRWPWEKPEPEPVRPPKVGGTRAPSNIEKIDFDQPHDFHFRFGYEKGTLKVFTNCRLDGLYRNFVPRPKFRQLMRSKQCSPTQGLNSLTHDLYAVLVSRHAFAVLRATSPESRPKIEA